jgi:hypothetical protein
MRPVLLPRASLAVVSTLATLVIVLGWASAVSGFRVIRSTGDVGHWEALDRPADPGARCRYIFSGTGSLPAPGAVGTLFLHRVSVGEITIQGTKPELRSVGYRLLLQRHTSHGWRTTQRGHVIMGEASRSSPAHLPGSRIDLDSEKSPEWGLYRAVLRVVWWDEAKHVQGVEVAAVEHHRRGFDRVVRPACRARFAVDG